MKIILANNKELQALGVCGKTVGYQGVMRDSLTFLFSPQDTSIEELLMNFTDTGCSRILIIDDDGNEFVHENYTIRVEAGCGYKDMVISGTVSGDDKSQVVYVKMVQTTLAERTIQHQQEAIDALTIALLEG